MPSSPEQVKAAQAQVVDLMKQRQYDRAIGVLMTLDHPKKTQWIAQVEARKRESEFENAIGSAPVAPANPTPSLPVVKKQRGPIYRFVRGLIIGIASIFACSYWLLAQNGGTFTVAPTPIPVSTEMMKIEPQNVSIQDNGTTLGKDFLAVVRNAVADYGYISAYESQVDASNRLILDMEIQTVPARNNRASVNASLAAALRAYATNIPPDNQGAIHAASFYEVNKVPCGENVGAGYRVIQSMDWQNISDTDIFRGIDRGVYGDMGEHYSELGHSLNPPALGVCKA